MARRKPQEPAQDVEASGLEEFHPDTTPDPAEAAPRPPVTHRRDGRVIPDRRARFKEV